MSEVTVDRNVDISALPFESTSRWDGTSCTIVAPGVDEATLAAAVAAAPDALDLIQQREQRRTIEDAARAHLGDLRTLAQSSGALTNTQRDNALRLLARGQIRVIRLVLGELDATD